jgi:hypothetical protein
VHTHSATNVCRERDQARVFRRQKFVATAVAEQELEILESYSAIEKEMLTYRRDIEVQGNALANTIILTRSF